MEDTVGRTAKRIVLAPDKFKGSVTALEVIDSMAQACHAVDGIVVDPMGLADGGDGSVDAALSRGWDELVVPATDAWGGPVSARIAVHEGRAIVEVATICGLGARRPSAGEAAGASTRGVGVVLSTLVEHGFHDVTLALGGSATTDGGAGMLRALGAVMLDGRGDPIGDGPDGLLDCRAVDLSGALAAVDGLELRLACDVDTPMVGVDGSAEMFARQKGADDDTVQVLSAALAQLASVIEPAAGHEGASTVPGSGAAGGLAWAGLVIGGTIRPGSEVFLDLLDAERVIGGATLVVTGEGCLDEQSLRGKAPVAVARLAAGLDVPAIAIVGSNRLPESADHPFARVIALDRIDPACASDPSLTRVLLEKVMADVLANHLPTLTTTGDHR
ncbi:glycerate kinase [Aeromicrobium endophyticum]|uniref:Glycerate kinase n=1 Tax=Aeromicrobium endophyticum TaxID=2292704 RepID=A0A371PC74_9ACTN|nr:glycerate kinase [Aeromicrobium endophyticum]REK73148.1 glycerate kinase [Aeromicrobium endophyticum]